MSQPGEGEIVRADPVTISGTIDPVAVDLFIEADDDSVINPVLDGSGIWSIEHSFTQGNHALTAVASFDDGSSVEIPVHFTVNLTPDAPTITDPPGQTATIPAIGSTLFDISGTSTPNVNVKLYYDIGTGPVAYDTRASDEFGQWTIPVSKPSFDINTPIVFTATQFNVGSTIVSSFSTCHSNNRTLTS